jgi:hypothetical protein
VLFLQNFVRRNYCLQNSKNKNTNFVATNSIVQTLISLRFHIISLFGWLVLVCSERKVLLVGCGWLLVAGSF